MVRTKRNPAYRKLWHYRNTKVIEAEPGVVRVRLYATDIVTWYRGLDSIDPKYDTIVDLDTGGYDTVTTRKRMNEAARVFGLNFCVFHKRGKLFVHDGVTGKDLPFGQRISLFRQPSLA